jgi:hypothetical protein
VNAGLRSRANIVLLGCAVCAAAGGVALSSRAAHRHPGGAAIVAVVGRTPITAHDLTLARKSAPGTTAGQARVQLVRDAVLVDAARGLNRLGGLTLQQLAADPAQVAALNERLYDYAARNVKGGPPVRPAGDEGVGVPADESSDAAGRQFDAWFLARDRVASVWFGRLYARYQHLTH